MQLSAPKQITFWIAVAFGALSLISKIVPALWDLGLAGWFALIGFAVLAAGNLIKDL